ncbi:MAG: ABC transporter ATP-binding protein [Dehalococcoidaceae bacterium]|nr:ABC transporter ATP-binding protein [Dehalococcoidaceae bacterium]
MEHAIIAEELVYSYGKQKAVDGISFQISQGEILGFLGPNGAGKSTTVNMLTGLLKPQGGRAVLLGRDISKDVDSIQKYIGVCFEGANLYEQMTGEENLKLFARLFDVKNFDVKALIARVGLEGRGKDRAGSYSKGMKQRLMVARSLINRPEILFLDEPTDGLDPASAESIRRVIQEERDRGATVFLTTHDMMEADKLSDRVAFINQGKIVALDTSHNLKQQYGKRALNIEVLDAEGKLQTREIILDTPDTPSQVREIMASEKVVTIHSEEATLEDIFIRITGRGLS